MTMRALQTSFNNQVTDSDPDAVDYDSEFLEDCVESLVSAVLNKLVIRS